ncbi:proline-rich extensin-like protein EPR1 [Drosophila santomea]|uniref:proline-rich extensin-like protein EPR1 n=1 Tax=Drosophila santomea TaxID=129105 RepID=UPI001954B027|nr:proline-rich extensin-like protein EPR1 [Drosophila santomea]
MAHKFLCSLLLIAAMSAVSLAEPTRFRGRSARLQFARQEQAPEDQAAPVDPAVDIVPTPASAPYPPSGVTPEVPFDLPTETEAQPDLTYGPPAQPDNTYGPPDNTYGPPAEPENTYGPPADGPSDQPPVADPVPAGLIQPRNERLRSRRPTSQKLRSAQTIRSGSVLVYTI